MQKLIVKGKKSLSGIVKISGSKNATLPILAASILSDKKVEIKNVPLVEDVITMYQLLKHIGSNIKIISKAFVHIKSGKLTDFFDNNLICLTNKENRNRFRLYFLNYHAQY